MPEYAQLLDIQNVNTNGAITGASSAEDAINAIAKEQQAILVDRGYTPCA